MSLLSRYITPSLLVDDSFYGIAKTFLRPLSSYYPSSTKSRTFRVNDDKIKIEVELAGYNRDQVEVYEESGYLVVSAKVEKDDLVKSYYDSWVLPDNSKVDKVKYENGLLSIEILKSAPPKPTRTKYQIE